MSMLTKPGKYAITALIAAYSALGTPDNAFADSTKQTQSDFYRIKVNHKSSNVWRAVSTYLNGDALTQGGMEAGDYTATPKHVRDTINTVIDTTTAVYCAELKSRSEDTPDLCDKSRVTKYNITSTSAFPELSKISAKQLRADIRRINKDTMGVKYVKGDCKSTKEITGPDGMRGDLIDNGDTLYIQIDKENRKGLDELDNLDGKVDNNVNINNTVIVTMEKYTDRVEKLEDRVSRLEGRVDEISQRKDTIIIIGQSGSSGNGTLVYPAAPTYTCPPVNVNCPANTGSSTGSNSNTTVNNTTNPPATCPPCPAGTSTTTIKNNTTNTNTNVCVPNQPNGNNGNGNNENKDNGNGNKNNLLHGPYNGYLKLAYTYGNENVDGTDFLSAQRISLDVPYTFKLGSSLFVRPRVSATATYLDFADPISGSAQEATATLEATAGYRGQNFLLGAGARTNFSTFGGDYEGVKIDETHKDLFGVVFGEYENGPLMLRGTIGAGKRYSTREATGSFAAQIEIDAEVKVLPKLYVLGHLEGDLETPTIEGVPRRNFSLFPGIGVRVNAGPVDIEALVLKEEHLGPVGNMDGFQFQAGLKFNLK